MNQALQHCENIGYGIPQVLQNYALFSRLAQPQSSFEPLRVSTIVRSIIKEVIQNLVHR